MSKNESGVEIQCPFYRKVKVNSIGCEGLIPDSKICNIFETAAEKNKQISLFCSDGYKTCEVYIALRGKYE